MKKLLPYILAVAITIPGFCIRLLPLHFDPPLIALFCGLSILGASFLLTWACEVAQMDIPQALAVAVVAFIAVLPEYSVDMYFTWMAGQQPHSQYSHFAIANMTGANRLLIGIGWSAIVLIFAFRYHEGVDLDEDKRTDVLFLLLATLYALLIPLKGSLTIWDGILLFAIYVWYIAIIIKRSPDEEEPQGPAALLAALSKKARLWTIGLLFAFSAIAILLNAEPFSENLVETGKLLGINEFLLVQWLAPIASESPEFVVALMFAFRGNASLALASLLSSKLNQWTLLVGMIPSVYAVSFGGITPPINLDSHQFQEIFLTAGQSLFACALLVNLHLHKNEAWILLGLFVAQLTSPLYEHYLDSWLALPPDPLRLHGFFGWVYLVLAIIVFARHWRQAMLLGKGFRP